MEIKLNKNNLQVENTNKDKIDFIGMEILKMIGIESTK